MTISSRLAEGDALGHESARQLIRRSARDVCAWYEPVHVARAAASCRYRIGNFVELFSGVNAVIGSRFPARLLDHVRTVSCLRPLVTPGFSRRLAKLKSAGVRLVADYDDLLFAGDVTGLPTSVAGTGSEREQRARLRDYGAALGSFDAFTVSTLALGQRLKHLVPGATVSVIPNALSESWVAQGLALYRKFEPGDPLVMRYLAGSPSHDDDFAAIIPTLARFLREHPNVRLEIVGPLRVDVEAFPEGAVMLSKSVPYDDLPRLLTSAWVNLAPLADSEFNACKSAIKFLEAGAFGCPTLASPNEDVMRHRELGAPVTLCRSDQDWFGALEAMLDPDYRMTLGADSAQHVARHGMARDQGNAWYRALTTSSAS